MNLKYRIILFTVPLLACILAIMLVGEYFAVYQFTKRHDRITLHNQHVTLEKQSMSTIQLNMRSHVRDLTRNQDVKQLLTENNNEKLKHTLSYTAERLKTLGVADEVLLINLWGKIIYHSESNTPHNTYLVEPLLHKSIEENIIQFGPIQTKDGDVKIALIFPIYDQRKLVGAAIYLKDLESTLKYVSESINVAILMIDTDYEPLFTTDLAIWDALKKEGIVKKRQEITTLTHNHKYYTAHRRVLKNINDRVIGTIFLVSDTTELHLAQNKIYWRITFVSMALLLFVTIALWWYVHRAFKPLQKAIETVNRSAEGNLESIDLPQTNNNEVSQLAQAVAKFHSRQLATISRIQAANRAKSQFLANMSHEIRTPLNAIIGFAEILQEKTTGTEQKEHCENILSSAENLLTIINDVLDLSKIEAGQFQLNEEAINFRHVVQNIVHMLAAAHHKKGLQFHCTIANEVPLFVKADAQRLRQVLINLIGNAAKFTPQGHVWVSFKVLSVEGKKIVLEGTVQDTGIGIPSNQLHDIFEKFQQADNSSTRKFQGTGLGLSITREFIELMGGHIDVSSTVGKGTAFTFTLALEISQQPVQEKAPPKRTHIKPNKDKPLKILLVEDNPSNQLVAQHMLKPLNAEVHLAANGQEAIDKVKVHQYDLILMDCQMPILDGYGATAAIRAFEEKNNIPPQLIIALTANVMTDDQEKCLVAGMDDFLPKPITRAQLAEILKEHDLI